MDSDFDDLLNEFDSPKVSVSKASAPRGKSEIDDLFEELKGIEKPEPLRMAPLSMPAEERKKKTEKCYPVVVSGGSKTGYCMSSMNMVACDKLRCTRCDLPVKRFPGKQWKPGAEYLFFRNNFSRDDQLSAMMDSSVGAAAYSCQCNWRSAREPTNINGESWVCAGHYI